MAKGINISIASQTRDFDSGVRKGIIDPLQDAEKALEGLGDSGRDAGDDVEKAARDAKRELDDLGDAGKDAGDDLEKSMRDAQRDTKELGDDYDDLARQIRDAGRKGSSDYRQSSSEMTTAAQRDLEELKDEGLQNASEMFSSFDGSVESLADAVQGTLGGVVSNMGFVGAAIGAAGAAGVGLFMAHLERAEEEAQAVRERAAELTEEFIETGETGSRSLGAISEALVDLATDTDDTAYKLSDLYQLARDFQQIDFRDASRGLAGDPAALERTIAKTEELLEVERELTAKRLLDQGVTMAGAESAEERRLETLLDALGKEKEARELALEQHAAWVAAGGELEQQRAEAAQAASESIQDALLEQGAAVDDFLDEESGLFDTEAYLAAFEERAEAVRLYQQNMRTASETLNSEALAYIQSLGIDAAPMLQAYINSPLDQQQRLEDVWAQLGKTATDSYIAELENNMPASIEGPAVNIGTINDLALRQWMAQPRYVNIQTVAHLPRGERGWN